MNILSLIELFKGNIPENLKGFFGSFSTPVLIVAVTVGVAVAFFGYKLFRASLAVIGAIFFGTAANLFYPTISTFMGNFTVESLDMRTTTVIAAALIGALLMRYLHKLALFLAGGIFGWSFGAVALYALLPRLSEIEFLKTEAGVYTALIASVLLFAILTPLLFKLLFIFLTSVLSLTACAVAVAMSLFNSADYTVLTVSAVMGLALGFVAMVYQYRAAEDY